MHRSPIHLFTLWIAVLIAGQIWTADYSDPEQPATRESIQRSAGPIPWYKPFAGGSLNILAILPYQNVNEIDQLSHRLDITTTVLGTLSRYQWQQTDSTVQLPARNRPDGSLPLSEEEAKLALSLTHRYDSILIGKVSWSAIPGYARDLILEHVKRGCGLLYISPNELTPESTISTTPGKEFVKLFTGPDSLHIYRTVNSKTAFAFSSIVYFRDRATAATLPGLPRHLFRQAPLYITSHVHHQGRIIVLDYDDAAVRVPDTPALTPCIFQSNQKHAVARTDLWNLGLSMGLLHAADRFPVSQVSFLSKSVVPTPRVDRNQVRPGHFYGVYPRQFYRYRLPDAEYYVVPPAARDDHKFFRYRIRSPSNLILVEKDIPITTQDRITFKLPIVEHAHYLLDGHYLDKQGKIISSGSTSFQVVSDIAITQCELRTKHYTPGDEIQGEFSLSRNLQEDQHVQATLFGPDGKQLLKLSPTGDAFARRFRFTGLTQHEFPQRCFLHCTVHDADGVAFRHITPLPVSDTTAPTDPK